MRRYIFKFELHPTDGGSYEIPLGSFLLDVQVQDGCPVMWWSIPARACPSTATWPRRTFEIVPTGHPGYEEGYYVGTFQLGGFVGHVLSDQSIPRTLDEAYAATEPPMTTPSDMGAR